MRYILQEHCSIITNEDTWLCSNKKKSLVFELNYVAGYILNTIRETEKTIDEIVNEIITNFEHVDSIREITEDVKQMIAEFEQYGIVTGV